MYIYIFWYVHFLWIVCSKMLPNMSERMLISDNPDLLESPKALPSPQLAISSSARHFFVKTRLPSFHHAVTPRKTNNRSSPSRCWPSSHSVTTLSSDMLAIMANNVLEIPRRWIQCRNQHRMGDPRLSMARMSQVLCQRHCESCQRIINEP